MVVSKAVVLLVLVSCPLFVCGQDQFTNPITDFSSSDGPHILQLGSEYFMTVIRSGRDIAVYRSSELNNFRGKPSVIIHQPNAFFDSCHSPELHLINAELFCYFTMHRIGETGNRIWVAKAKNASDPMGAWDAAFQLMQDEPEDSNDGTVFKHPTNGRNYFIFSRQRPSLHSPSLYIAPLNDPMNIEHPRILLRIPSGSWECEGGCSSNAPNMLIGSNNISHLVFSGSQSGSRTYALGRMSILPEEDPLVPSSWGPAKGPIFAENDAQSVYGPGHASFVQSPDGSENWMLYAAQNTPNNGNYMAYLDKIQWDMIGYPVFPIPHGEDSPQTIPSGQ